MQWLSTARQLVIPFPDTRPDPAPSESNGLPPRGCRARTAGTLLAARSTNPTFELLGVAAMLAMFVAVAILA